MTDQRMFAAWRDFRSGLSCSPAELEELQLGRMRRLVAHAYENVPYYQNLFDSVGFQPRHLKRLSDLEAIPVTSRERLQSTPRGALIARGYSVDKLRHSRTGGSSGRPLTVYRSQKESRLGLFYRLRSWFHQGLRWNDHVLTISGRPSTTDRRPWMRSLPLPARWNTHILGKPETILETFVRLRPSVLYGYSFKVAMLAGLARERAIPNGHLRMVATSGDMLLPRFREMIREAWNVDPIDIYNCTEVGDIGWQCQRREGFHLNADQTYVEFLRNRRPVQEGEEGEVVLTQLYRYAMPMIRYSPGDLATPGEAPCSCGLGLPTMQTLEGRTLSAVPLPNGRAFMGFNRLLSDFRGVERFQIVQKALDHFELSVVPAADYSPEVLTKMTQAIQARLGQEIRVEARPVAESELIQNSRKHQPVIPLCAVDFGNVREA